MTIQIYQQHAVALPGTSLDEFTNRIGDLIDTQKGLYWWLGDLVRQCKQQHGENWYQALPVDVSPGLISRCDGVSAAYQPDERNIGATWTIHANNAKRPDRIDLVQASVDAGQTSDEARKNPAPVPEPEPVKELEPVPVAEPTKQKWLLAVDVSYYVHSTFSQAGVDTASTVEAWLVRLINRLKETKGLTDVVCCLDSRNSFRKDLTKDWEHPYKLSRVDKEEELRVQFIHTIELIRNRNILCVSIDGMEADDVMASYAKQFDGKVTLMTKDKDLRQCLSDKCNMLTDVTWETNSETGNLVPKYSWVTAATHMKAGLTYQSCHVDGITPEAFPHMQAIAGDTGDNVKGAIGIGPKAAMDLIKEHGTVQAVIAACKDGQVDLTEKKRIAILDFEDVSEITLQLVTMVDTLPVPKVTTICMKEET